jgi:hypothetical protein
VEHHQDFPSEREEGLDDDWPVFVKMPLIGLEYGSHYKAPT